MCIYKHAHLYRSASVDHAHFDHAHFRHRHRHRYIPELTSGFHSSMITDEV